MIITLDPNYSDDVILLLLGERSKNEGWLLLIKIKGVLINTGITASISANTWYTGLYLIHCGQFQHLELNNAYTGTGAYKVKGASDSA